MGDVVPMVRVIFYIMTLQKITIYIDRRSWIYFSDNEHISIIKLKLYV